MNNLKKEICQKFIRLQKNQAPLDNTILKKHMLTWRKLLIGKMLNKLAELLNFLKKLCNMKLMKLMSLEI